jgi:hypothetical protein
MKLKSKYTFAGHGAAPVTYSIAIALISEGSCCEFM